MKQDVAITKYTIKFGVVYTIGLIVLSAIFYIFDLDHSSGASIGVLIGAAMYAAGKFIQDNKRVPSKNEKSKMVWSSFVILWLVSVMLLLIVVLIIGGNQGLTELTQLAAKLNVAIVVGVTIFVSLVYLAILYYSYGGLARKQFDGLKKKGKI